MADSEPIAKTGRSEKPTCFSKALKIKHLRKTQISERSDEVGCSRPAGPGILEHSEKIRKGGKAAGYVRGGAPDKKDIRGRAPDKTFL